MVKFGQWEIHPSQSYMSPKFSEYKKENPNGMELANWYLHKREGECIAYNKHHDKILTDIEYDADERLLAKAAKIEEEEKATEHLEMNLSEKDISIEESLRIKTCLYSITNKLSLKDIDNLLFHPGMSLKNIILYSDPGSGKTSKVKDFLKRKKQKFIFLAPLRFQVNQMKKDNMIASVMGGQKADLSELVKSNPYIVTTYEYFPQIDKLILNKWEYYLVIDEFHKIVSDSDYRGSSLSYIYDTIHNYQRFIGLTGTPLGCVNPHLNNSHGTEVIQVKSIKRHIPVKKTYNIIQYKQTDPYERSDESCFYSYISKYANDSINIVFANRKKLLQKIQTKLIADGLLKDGQSTILTSDEKDNPEIIEIIDNERVNKSIKFIFATSVMSTGVNLKGQKFKNIFIYKERNLIEIVQFLHRFRQGIENVYDFIPENNKPIFVTNVYKKYIEYFDAYKKIAESFNNVYKEHYNLIKKYTSNSSDSIIKDGIIYCFEDQVRLNENRVLWKALSELHSVAFHNKEIRKEYFSLYNICGTINTIADPKIYNIDFTNGETLSNEQKQRLQEETLSHLKLNMGIIASYFKKKNILNTSLFEMTPIKNIIQELTEEKNSFCENLFFSTLGNKTVKKTVSELLFFYGIGLTIDCSIELVKKNQYGKITKTIEFLRLMPLMRIPDWEYKQQFLPWIITQVKFAERIDKYMMKHKEYLDFHYLKTSMAKDKEPVNFIKHFQLSTRERLGLIYKIKDTTKTLPDKTKKRIYKCSGLNTAADIFNIIGFNPDKSDIKFLDEYLNSGNPRYWIQNLSDKI